MSLTDLKIKTAKPKEKQYKLSDGDGLFLLVHPNGSKYWRFRYYYQGQEKLKSMGKYPAVSLSEARYSRDEAKSLLMNGIEPIRHKKAEQEMNITFEEIARKWCDKNKKWSEIHKTKVLRSLETYIFPKIGSFILESLTTRELVIPIQAVEELGKIELATRLQQRVSAVMRYAVQNGHIKYNPAQDLRGVVSSVEKVHRPSIRLKDVPELLERIDHFKGRELTRLAIKLTLLTFIRSSELRFARWSEINFEERIWTIPAERKSIEGVKYSYRGTKMKTPHLVPLSHQAISILKQIYEISGMYELIFIGDHSAQKPMSENTINKALRSMGYTTKDLCGHGFRAIARTAIGEANLWGKEIIELQMSHQERNKVVASYTYMIEHLEQRIDLMQWWADYLDSIRTEFVMPYKFKTA